MIEKFGETFRIHKRNKVWPNRMPYGPSNLYNYYDLINNCKHTILHCIKWNKILCKFLFFSNFKFTHCWVSSCLKTLTLVLNASFLSTTLICLISWLKCCQDVSSNRHPARDAFFWYIFIWKLGNPDKYKPDISQVIFVKNFNSPVFL